MKMEAAMVRWLLAASMLACTGNSDTILELSNDLLIIKTKAGPAVI